MTGRDPEGRSSRTDAVVDVIVVTHNSAGRVGSALEELVEAQGLNVIVVDNGSTDETRETVEALGIRVIAQDNRGFAHGCNRGWRAGLAPAVMFLNPDARISPTHIRLLASALDDPTVGIVGPLILEGERIAYSQRRFPRVPSTFGQALFASRLLPRRAWVDEVVRDERKYAEPRDVEWLSGACLLVRRSLLVAVGGWDESYFLYSEDTQLCKAAWNVGMRVRFEPGAAAHHVGGESAPRARLLESLACSRMTYAAKNMHPPLAVVHRIGIGLEAATHALVCRGGMKQRRGHLRALRAVLEGRAVGHRHLEHMTKAA